MSRAGCSWTLSFWLWNLVLVMSLRKNMLWSGVDCLKRWRLGNSNQDQGQSPSKKNKKLTKVKLNDQVNSNQLLHLDLKLKNPDQDQVDMTQRKQKRLDENKNCTKKNLKENEKKNFFTWKNKRDFKRKSSKLKWFCKDRLHQIKMQSLNTLHRHLIFKENRLPNSSGRSKSSIEIEKEQQGLTSQILSSKDSWHYLLSYFRTKHQ